MLSPSTSFALSFFGWLILPDLITAKALNFVHQVLPKPPPQRGTQRYATHYRITYAIVVLSYLTYNLFTSAASMPANYYQMLGVGVNAEDSGLRTAYKAWVKRSHPDKMGGSASAEAAFRVVQEGFEVLKDPVRRSAYDRFGPDVLGWTGYTTFREYLRHGLLQASGYHIVTAAGLIGLGSIGRPSAVTFWRYLLYFTLLATELSLILSPFPSPTISILQLVFPRRAPYQHIRFLHQLFMFLSIALSKVAPVLFPGEEAMGANTREQVMERMRILIGGLQHDVNSMLAAEFASISSPQNSLHFTPTPSTIPPPFTSLSPPTPSTLPPAHTMRILEREIEDMIIEGTIRDEAGDGPRGTLRGRGMSAAVRAVFAVTAADAGALRPFVRGDLSTSGRAMSLGAGMGMGFEQAVTRVRWSESAGMRAPLQQAHPLPSPRPSPSPSPTRPPPSARTSPQRPGYIRARSVSC